MERIEDGSEISTRRLAAEVGFSQFLVHRRIKEQGLHPYHIQNRLNVVQYLQFLNNVLKDQLDVEVLLGERVCMWYLLDGAPPHFDKPVAQWLNNHIPNQWVGRNGPVAWSPRSPDLNPCDFCL